MMQTQNPMQTPIFDMYRAGLKTAAEMMRASIESAQRLQQQQLDAVNTMLDEQLRSVRELSEAKSVDEFFTLQTKFTGSQMERTLDFWTRAWRTAGESGMGMASAGAAATGSSLSDAGQRIERAAQQRKTA